MFSFNFDADLETPSNTVARAKPPLASAAPELSDDLSISFVELPPTFNAEPAPRSVRFSPALVRVASDADAVSGYNLDLVPDKYEGGGKVWECTNDVIEWMQQQDPSTFQSARILELGAGAGMIGIAAMQLGARVCFQDLNAEVLRQITLRNVQLNTDAEAARRAIAIAASWGTLVHQLRDYSPDFSARDAGWLRGGVTLVLGSEILYNEAQYANICSLLLSVLAPGGRAIIGTKRHYFGVGGSTAAFTAAARSAGLLVTTLASISDGRSMTRDILEAALPLAAIK